ncbi:hypothetical protein JXM67_12355 [candidate division WOR-3 bacterium]|nr:hypothetical protein [candidate division WOR-3 bacterium]
MEQKKTNNSRKGIDFDISIAWYNPGGCPLRVWPTFERIEDTGEYGTGKVLVKEIPPS